MSASHLQGDSAAASSIPPLCSGDRLTRGEFERRYRAMSPEVRAELIEGVVFAASPVSAEDHGEPHSDLRTWLGLYRAHTETVRSGDSSSLRLDLDNEPQPDGYLRLLPECGGRARIVEGYLEDASELIAEISASSASYDSHDKLNAYRRSGVGEYIVWRVWDRQIDWFVLRSGRYERLPLGQDDRYRSEIFPGLWLDPVAMLRGDLKRVLAILAGGARQ